MQQACGARITVVFAGHAPGFSYCKSPTDSKGKKKRVFSFSWEEFLSPFVQLIDTGNTSSIQGSTACSGEIPAAYSGCQMGT